MTLLTTFVVLVFLHSLVSARLERTVLTPPMVFTAAGALAFFVLPGMQEPPASQAALLHIAEIGLVMLLFTDACRTSLQVLRHIGSLSLRLLSIGMLLTMALGMLAALGVLPGLSIWEAAILAAVLAPTDAGLGQVIVENPLVPLRIRQTLNVEAGLNDGLSVPFLLFFIAMAERAANADVSLGGLIGEQLGLGTLVGLGIGLGGGLLLRIASRAKWLAHSWQQLGVVALPVLCVIACHALHASMFIAAFVGGLAVQVRFAEAAESSIEFTEGWGRLLNLSVFFLLGLMVARALPQFEWPHAVYAVLSLTVVRMLPVAIALGGAKLSRATVLFMGWFGPRGLASIVLGLVYLAHEEQLAGESTIRLAVMSTVALSVFAHGASALPGIAWYARKVAVLPPGAPEGAAGAVAAPGPHG
ncbi:MAG TPA: cation:proton antiporter [Planctomycetota bacterium]|nr:cation:proton antiporter [Planctomycetota bacterium]